MVVAQSMNQTLDSKIAEFANSERMHFGENSQKVNDKLLDLAKKTNSPYIVAKTMELIGNLRRASFDGTETTGTCISYLLISEILEGIAKIAEFLPKTITTNPELTKEEMIVSFFIATMESVNNGSNTLYLVENTARLLSKLTNNIEEEAEQKLIAETILTNVTETYAEFLERKLYEEAVRVSNGLLVLADMIPAPASRLELVTHAVCSARPMPVLEEILRT